MRLEKTHDENDQGNFPLRVLAETHDSDKDADKDVRNFPTKSTRGNS